MDFWPYGNFTKTDDGLGNTSYNGYQRAEDLIIEANSQLASNSPQSRKNPNYPTSHYDPAPDNNIRYLLAGVYFHHNNTYYDNPRSNIWSMHASYNIDNKEVIDVYLTPNDRSGAAPLDACDKFAHVANWRPYVSEGCRAWSVTFGGATINHEIGHTLDLRHTWNRDDKCPDTPMGFEYQASDNCPGGAPCCTRNANCWTINSNSPHCGAIGPCDDWANVSNNIMDYNNPYQQAYTKEQIALINANLASSCANEVIHSCNGCMPSLAFFDTKDIYRICGPQKSIIINGQASFNETDYLIEICEVSSATSQTCLPNTYYSNGWVTGSIDILDLSQMYNFLPNKFYKIKLTVNNSDCPSDDVFEKIIEVKGCLVPISDLDDLIPTNPFGPTIVVSYNLLASGSLELYLTHTITGSTILIDNHPFLSAGTYSSTANTSSLPSGSYQVTAIFNGYPYTVTTIKI